MRRAFVTLAAVLISVGALSAPVSAAPGSSLNRQVTGPFTGTSTFDFRSSACSFAHQVFTGRYGAAQRRNHGFFRLDGCVILEGADAFTFNGSFTIVTPRRAVLRGTVTGPVGQGPSGVCDPSVDFPSSLDFTLVLAHGTKTFRHATGSLRLTGVWCSPSAPDTPGRITGDLAGALRHRR